MPQIRQHVTKRMDRRLRSRTIGVGHHKQHPGGTKRNERIPGRNRADAYGADRVIASASGYRYRGVQPPAFGHLRVKGGGNLAAFNQGRHLAARQAAFIQQSVGPVALRHVQPQRPGGVGHIGDFFTGHPVAQIILRQQHRGGALKVFRLMATHPQQLRRGKAGHRQISRHLMQLRRPLLQLRALRGAAGVVPQDCRADRLPVGIQQNRAVHLPGKANGLNGRPVLGAFFPQRGHQILRRLPP